MKTAIIGIGNEGRGDDGLGWRFGETIEWTYPNMFDIFLKYQLQIEDAALINDYECILFVDAHKGHLVEGFELIPIQPEGDFSYTSHALKPQAILHLSLDLYNYLPEAYLLVIEGDYWDLEVGLSSKANNNLKNALRYFKKWKDRISVISYQEND